MADLLIYYGRRFRGLFKNIPYTRGDVVEIHRTNQAPDRPGDGGEFAKTAILHVPGLNYQHAMKYLQNATGYRGQPTRNRMYRVRLGRLSKENQRAVKWLKEATIRDVHEFERAVGE